MHPPIRRIPCSPSRKQTGLGPAPVKMHFESRVFLDARRLRLLGHGSLVMQSSRLEQFHDVFRPLKVGSRRGVIVRTTPVVAAMGLTSSAGVELEIDDSIPIAPGGKGRFLLSRNDVMSMFRKFPCPAACAMHAFSGTDLLLTILVE